MAKPTTSSPKKTAKALTVAERQRAALELRTAGKNFDAIAAELGYSSRSAAHKAVVSALRDVIAEPAEDVRQLELARLDGLYERALTIADDRAVIEIGSVNADRPAVLALATDARARVAALQAAVKVMERRAKLLGLDAATKVEAKVKAAIATPEWLDSATDEQLTEWLRAELAAKGAS